MCRVAERALGFIINNGYPFTTRLGWLALYLLLRNTRIVNSVKTLVLCDLVAG